MSGIRCNILENSRMNTLTIIGFKLSIIGFENLFNEYSHVGYCWKALSEWNTMQYLGKLLGEYLDYNWPLIG